ncbi:hypothetical protein [Chitinophaga arvensicola]|uniref:Uncharacterized protein n=1 Tax=Chitinophaga arvensicola TaxID=29529 RepID=A0A1I0QCK5_9BACT|nr:hypothetical protein [Chitinophaga arvensicola]SEW24319.1 hypothetical protein SAMN04488122_1353 [Chitinophaga arvensicola]
MPIASTSFLKARIPGASVAQLLKLYEREILTQGAGQTAIRDNMVAFSGSSQPVNRQAKKFADYTDGRLIVTETDSTFEVCLEAEYPGWKFLFDVYFTKLRDDLEKELQLKVSQ